MKTLVLLAGQSKRFWPLTEKPLFPIAGKTILEHIIARLEASGCTDITLIGSKYNMKDIESLAELPVIEQEKLELGMRGALLSALPSCGDEDVLIVGGNDIIDASAYHATVEAGQQIGMDPSTSLRAGGALLAQTVSRYFPGGYLSVKDDRTRPNSGSSGRITGIVEKPGEGKEPSNLVNIVCHYHRNAAMLLDALNKIE
ncbi:MAG TPA: sugar phosphate nucleotidyltransferase, partial [Candidatus Peribacteraceae bacterium]|nr:sugar phosphate nucleotidyltransferase [Candidatus Peribacteraceae bacterium]